MPADTTTHAAYAQLLNRVLHRHAVSQADLARLTGYSESQVSRYCDGQFAVPAHLLVSLLAATGDAELRETLSAGDPRPLPYNGDAMAKAIMLQQQAHRVAEGLIKIGHARRAHEGDDLIEILTSVRMLAQVAANIEQETRVALMQDGDRPRSPRRTLEAVA